jgi:putative transposase
MPGSRRVCLANEVFHVLNRAVARMIIFEKPGNDDAFLCVLDGTWAEIPLPILAFTAMPSHWHFVVRPASDEQVSESIRRLTIPS